jgi:hypothetical protein
MGRTAERAAADLLAEAVLAADAELHGCVRGRYGERGERVRKANNDRGTCTPAHARAAGRVGDAPMVLRGALPSIPPASSMAPRRLA